MSNPAPPRWVEPYAPHAWTDKEIPDYDTLNLYLRDYSDYLLQPPMCKVHATTVQAISNAYWWQVNFGAEDFDNDSMWDQSGIITIHTAGYYVGNASICYATGQTGGGTGYRWQTLYSSRDGGDIASSGEWAETSGYTKRLGVVFGPIRLDKGNYILLRAYQNSGYALNTNATDLEFASDFYCKWIGPA